MSLEDFNDDPIEIVTGMLNDTEITSPTSQFNQRYCFKFPDEIGK